jgi:hypothetical protein
MTYVDDLHEAGDREPEPCEWYPAPEPVDVDEVEQRLNQLKPLGALIESSPITHVILSDAEDVTALCGLVGHDVPALVAELIAARERIAEWEALETREEWAVTKSCDVSPPPHAYHYPRGDAAIRAAERHGHQAWRRALIVHPWQPIDSQPPL